MYSGINTSNDEIFFRWAWPLILHHVSFASLFPLSFAIIMPNFKGSLPFNPPFSHITRSPEYFNPLKVLFRIAWTYAYTI
jgi:hypothetical protein